MEWAGWLVMSDVEVISSAAAKLRRYALFISYRHADNLEMGRKWATWLHESVENYEVPEDLIGTSNLRGDQVPQSLYPVFRDEEELPADAELSNNIRRALENSSLLVVICSPRAVQSRFVADEIRYFKEIGRSGRILALIVDGEPNASDDPEKLARLGAGAECFPEPLRFGVSNERGVVDWSARTEPIAADCRPGGMPVQGWTTVAAYEASLDLQGGMDREGKARAVREYGERLELAKLKVIAGALGVPLGELTRRDKVRQLQRAKRRARILTSLSVVFAVLAGAAGVLGWMANERRKDADVQRREAETQRQEANRQKEQAEVRRVEAEEARTLADEEKRRAVATLAASDFQEGVNRLADPNSTRSGMAYLARSARAGHASAATRIWTLFQQESFWLPAGAPDAAPDVAERRMKALVLPEVFQKVELDGEEVEPTWYSESADGKRCVTVVSGGEPGEGPLTFRVWETNGEPLGPWRRVKFKGMHYLYEIPSAVLSEDGRFVAVVAGPWRESQYVEVWDVDQGRRIGEPILAGGGHPNDQGGAFNDVWFTPHPEGKIGPMLVTLSSRGNAALHRIDADAESSSMWEVATHSHDQPVTMGEVAHDLFISHAVDGSIRVSSTGEGMSVGWPIAAGTGVEGLRIDAADRFSVRMAGGGTEAWRLLGPTRLPLSPLSPQAELAVGEDRRGLHKSWDEEVVVEPLIADERDRRVLEIAGGVELRLREGGRAEPVWRRRFAAPVVHARFLGAREILVQTEFFTTEIWDVAEDAVKHPVVGEAAMFGAGEASDTVLLSERSGDGRFLLTRSFRWIPPNLGIYAFTVWDVATGKPLSKRQLLSDDVAVDDVEVWRNHAEFSEDSGFLLLGRSDSEAPVDVTANLQLVPPGSVADRVADLAEALGGLRLKEDGNLAEVGGDVGEVVDGVLKALPGK